jgi:Ni/Co efflux regulator RcnB
MMRWFGVAVVAGAFAWAAPAAATAPQAAMSQRHEGKVTDVSAQRHHRQDHRSYRPYDRSHDAHYYARPSDYRPYPYVFPAPFTFGFAFGPSW